MSGHEAPARSRGGGAPGRALRRRCGRPLLARPPPRPLPVDERAAGRALAVATDPPARHGAAPAWSAALADGLARLPLPVHRWLPLEQRVHLRQRLGRFRPGEDGFDLTPPRPGPGETTGPPDYVGVGATGSGSAWWHRLVLDHPGVSARPDLPPARHFLSKFATRPFGPDEVRAYRRLVPPPSRRGGGQMDPTYATFPWVAPLLGQAAPDARVRSWCAIRWSGCAWSSPTDPTAGGPGRDGHRRGRRRGLLRGPARPAPPTPPGPTGAGPPVRTVPGRSRRPAGRHLPVPRTDRGHVPPGRRRPAPERQSWPSPSTPTPVTAGGDVRGRLRRARLPGPGTRPRPVVVMLPTVSGPAQ